MSTVPAGTEWTGKGCPLPTDKYDILTSEHMNSCPICGPRIGAKYKEKF
ncbi:hypothetical protein ART_1600 [Arthrobacter sp. PAMC 25486]|nr:hypothetical protein ART_1600 [Arthrobacter sp. PAMC 25486]